MIDKQMAVKLRQQGMTYSEISEVLGCSDAWCKKNLKDVDTQTAINPEVKAKQKAIAILEVALSRLRAI